MERNLILIFETLNFVFLIMLFMIARKSKATQPQKRIKVMFDRL